MPPPVQILMCTHNGAAFVQAQLDSFVAQEHSDWALWVGDDASTDETPELLSHFAAAHPGRDVRMLPGPGAGSARNFLALLCHPDLPPGYTAFSDQDDVWLPHKLSRALAALGGDPGRPAVYASRTWLTGPDLENPRASREFPYPPAFGNALVQNILAGNTIVLNPAATALMRAAGPAEAAANVPYHDWWVYQLMTGAGARIVTDLKPGLYYRQHGGNMLGSNMGAVNSLKRLKIATDRRFTNWIDRNTAALDALRDLLTDEACATLDGLAALRRTVGPRALAALDRHGIRRQSRLSDRVVRALAFAGKL